MASSEKRTVAVVGPRERRSWSPGRPGRPWQCRPQIRGASGGGGSAVCVCSVRYFTGERRQALGGGHGAPRAPKGQIQALGGTLGPVASGDALVAAELGSQWPRGAVLGSPPGATELDGAGPAHTAVPVLSDRLSPRLPLARDSPPPRPDLTPPVHPSMAPALSARPRGAGGTGSGVSRGPAAPPVFRRKSHRCLLKAAPQREVSGGWG